MGKTKSPKRMEFKPDIRSANAIIGAIAFLQKTGFAATPRAIKTCILQRSRKPADKIFGLIPSYLNRGLELGILKKFNGAYKLGEFEIKKRRKNNKHGGSKKKLKVLKEVGAASGEHQDEATKSSMSVRETQEPNMIFN